MIVVEKSYGSAKELYIIPSCGVNHGKYLCYLFSLIFTFKCYFIFKKETKPQKETNAIQPSLLFFSSLLICDVMWLTLSGGIFNWRNPNLRGERDCLKAPFTWGNCSMSWKVWIKNEGIGGCCSTLRIIEEDRNQKKMIITFSFCVLSRMLSRR